MHPAAVAHAAPDRAAVIVAESGVALTFRELDDDSRRLAAHLRALGLRPGARVGVWLGNRPEFFVAAWAAQRAGLYFVPIPAHAPATEAAYLLDDSGAEVVVAGAEVAAAQLGAAATPRLRRRICMDADVPGWEPYESVLPGSAALLDDECEGDALLYSSGSSGQPKGIRRPLTLAPMGHGPDGGGLFLDRLGLGAGDRFFTAAPLSHGAPLSWSMSAHRRGATVVVARRFEPNAALAALLRWRVTHSLWVPTMFARLLRLPDAVRAQYVRTWHRGAAHGAAPCPVALKRAMLDWWGPVISEYYSNTEGAGATFITPDEWAAHVGSVGRPVLGAVSIRDTAGADVAPGVVGRVWFSGGYGFRYHNDPARTRATVRSDGAASVGDQGFIDADGYLYLTGRESGIIISGGVNVSPWEVEAVLLEHPAVADAAVLGVADDDLGERVCAVVEVTGATGATGAVGSVDDDELARELTQYCARRLARAKRPRLVCVVERLPRGDNGKVRAADLLALLSARATPVDTP